MERQIEIVVSKRLDFKLNGGLKQEGYRTGQMRVCKVFGMTS